MCYHLGILKKRKELISMNIITAKEAREKTDHYISYSIQPTVEYVMEEIKDSCNSGNNSISFYKYIPSVYFENMKSAEFIEFMKKLGYKYNYVEKEYLGNYSEEIIISW